uniref:Aldo_ket_red domain-containing protein n=1 Tax=Bursaphelenchus xylophilus TaxID=6326 RepID=A0A1I7SM83_BURXY
MMTSQPLHNISYVNCQGMTCEELKLCKKLIQISSKSNAEPDALKEIAGVTIIRPMARNLSPQGASLAIEALRKRLPEDLVNFLHYKSNNLFK